MEKVNPDKKSRDSIKTSGLMKDVSSIFEKKSGPQEFVPSFFKKPRVKSPLNRWITKKQISSILETLSMPVFGTSGTVTGLDIGKSAIKVAQTTRGLKSTRLVNLTEIKIPSGLTDSQHNKFIEENLSGIIKPNFRKGTIVSSIHDTQMIMRVILIPSAITQEKMETAIRQKLEKQFNVNLTGRIVDYIKIGEKTERGIKQSVVLVTAVLKAIVDERQTLLKHLGFRFMVLEPGPFALARIFQERKEIIAILDVGEEITSLSVISNGNLQFSRYMYMTGSVLTKAVQEKLNIDYRKAEELKRNCGLVEEKNKEVYQILSFLVMKLARDIKLSLGYYSRDAAISSQTRIDKLVLSGGGSRLERLPFFLEENTGMPVELISSLPLDKIEVKGKKEKSAEPELSCSFATAAGLVLRKRSKGINFIPPKATVISELKELPFKLVAPVLTSIVLFFCILTHSQHSSKLRTCTEELKDRKKTLEVTNAKVFELTKRKKGLQEKIADKSEKIKTEEENFFALDRIFDNKPLWQDNLAELSSLLPENVWIRELSTHENTLRIKAVSLNNNLISGFMEKLDSSKLFLAVEFCKSEKEELFGQKVINFELACGIKKNASVIE